jgi:hypothetical protein
VSKAAKSMTILSLPNEIGGRTILPMNPQLSNQPTWFEPTAKLRALDGKSVRIKETSEGDSKLKVQDADPRGPDAGKCSVKAWAAPFDDVNAECTDADGATPTSQTHYGEKFLNENAVESLRENPDDPFVELTLDLTKS